ncbi:KAP family P-loop domain protein [Acinetobacter sp. ANC 5380]|uniref:KAP family P-loop domain protein n=1 Tax=Acinetobacter terrae TaxID=2731247 RepID=A0A7Y2WA26_9GAMM|nr:P-loop NTPase fold protein [Acinetobacter terrae]NNH15004.1 KAP family P-loop domain protein [Acinetobacter terrae]NNH76867.1 KAP family P-loop domain protein [Acinetobacter terrae]
MDQFERLEDIFKNNNNKGMAVAITGQWGIGKTFFWNKFINERAKREEERKYLPFFITQKYPNLFNKKYAYISLFGVESLADLKTAICTKLSSNHFNEFSSKNIETPILLKKFISQFRDIKVSQYGVSASARLIESFLFAQVNNAIICFDDFERMSKKLDIEDVMGLANQLKLERNCQVILILDEDKAEGENNKKYAEYKEKLIDETIKITSVEPLIRANTQGIDEQLVNLMVKFANELGIHNFRFFQKVIKLYKNFRQQLPDTVAYSTKEIILIRILQGYFIEDFGVENGLKWEDFSTENAVDLMDLNEDSKQGNEKLVILKKLQNLSYSFVFDHDRWLLEFRKWFDQKGQPNFQELNILANSDLISEKNNSIKEDIRRLMDQWRNLQVDQNYCDHLFQKSSESISFNDLKDLDFHCFLLRKFGRNDLSKQLKKAILNWLAHELQENYEQIWDDATTFGYKKDNLFHWYIKRWKNRNSTQGQLSFFDTLKPYILNGITKRNADHVLQQATQSDWHDFIFIQSSKDPELREITKGKLITEILKQNIDKNLTSSIKKIIENLLIVKLQASSNSSQVKNIEFVIDNFKKEGLL